MSAIDCLLADLIDYAGLYPPAALDLPAAAWNYIEYLHGSHAQALGRFVVDVDRFPALREAAGDSLRDFRLSLLAPAETDWSPLQRLLDEGVRIETIESIEIKANVPATIERIVRQIPAGPSIYIEVPVTEQRGEFVDAVAGAGTRIKLRMGGLTAEAFPDCHAVAEMLKLLADRRLAFKATAGLHHPLRSPHPLTDAPRSAVGTMHGFVNLACAAALIYFGGEAEEARRALDEENRDAWRITDDTFAWRSHTWSVEQLRTMRSEFFISFGSCSFIEPIEDLEALGWL